MDHRVRSIAQEESGSLHFTIVIAVAVAVIIAGQQCVEETFKHTPLFWFACGYCMSYRDKGLGLLKRFLHMYVV